MSEFENSKPMNEPKKDPEYAPADAMQFADDLDWMAFCYVANELSGEQLTQFESRLEKDQSAREAVASAMELSTSVYEAVQSAPSIATSGDQSSSHSSREFGFAKLAWALAGVVVLGVSLAVWIANMGDNSGALAKTQQEEDLAIVWVDSIQEVELIDAAVEFEDEFQFGDSSEADNDWMYVALSELEEDSGMPQ